MARRVEIKGDFTITELPPEPPPPPPVPREFTILSQLQYTRGWGLDDQDPGDPNSTPPIIQALNLGVPVSNVKSRHLPWAIDDGRFRSRIEKEVPEDWEGHISLDLEYAPLEALCEPNQPRAVEAMELFRRALRKAREWRPLPMYAFYAVPKTMYWEQTQEVWDHNVTFVPQLTQRQNWIAPSIYDAYKDADRDDDHLGWPIRLAKEMAIPIQKVLAFTTHRYTKSSKAEGWELLTDEAAQHNFGIALSNGADGYVLWGADPYYHYRAFQRGTGGVYVGQGPAYDNMRRQYEAEGCGEGGDIVTYNQQALVPKVHHNALTAIDLFDG